jgi:hypothetical protein
MDSKNVIHNPELGSPREVSISSVDQITPIVDQRENTLNLMLLYVDWRS